MLDLLKKKGNCTIFAAKIKAWNSWVETAQPICAVVVVFLLLLFCCCFFAKTVFFLLMLLIINFISDVRCALHA